MEDKRLATQLATEIMRELKNNAKKWFIAFIVMCVIEILTIAGFLWYISLPIEESTTTQEMDNVEGTELKQIIGDDY